MGSIWTVAGSVGTLGTRQLLTRNTWWIERIRYPNCAADVKSVPYVAFARICALVILLIVNYSILVKVSR